MTDERDMQGKTVMKQPERLLFFFLKAEKRKKKKSNNANEKTNRGIDREKERRDEVSLHLESCRHICSSMMAARQPSAVILDHSQVEQRYRLAPCLPVSFCTHCLKKIGSFSLL